MRRRGRGAGAAVVLIAAVACGPASETEPLPLQESALVIDDDVRSNSTEVAEFAVTEEQMERVQEACADAEAVPLEDGDACSRLMNLLLEGCDPPFDFCVRVFDVDRVDAPYAGWAEVVEGESGRSLCEDGPDGVCLRVGLSREVLTRVGPDPTEPTTDAPPTETSPTTDTTSTSGSTSPTTPSSSGEPSGSSTP